MRCIWEVSFEENNVPFECQHRPIKGDRFAYGDALYTIRNVTIDILRPTIFFIEVEKENESYNLYKEFNGC